MQASQVETIQEVLAEPALRQVIEKGFLGGRYVRAGRLFLVMGRWIFETGGVLGYAVTGYPVILGKVLGTRPDAAAGYVKGLKEAAAARLAEVASRPKTFFELYLLYELESLGVPRDVVMSFSQWGRSRMFNEKWRSKQVGPWMMITFDQGAGLGYHFHDKFKAYWEETYQRRPQDEWTKAREAGLDIPPQQEPVPFPERLATVLVTTLWYLENISPSALTPEEMRVLRRVTDSAIDELPQHHDLRRWRHT